MNRISKYFEQNKKALITFAMAYDPDYARSLAYIKDMAANGADIIEIGMPFSDPTADGIAIQKAGIRALQAGAKLKGILKLAAEFRTDNQHIPLILMGYYNPIFNYGAEKFFKDAEEAGIDGIIIVDLPPEESVELDFSTHISIIRLMTPTTTEERMKKILQNASGFIYYISIAGITGGKAPDIAEVKKQVEKIKKYSNLPVAVGFGIKSKEQVQEIHQFADAAVIGSSIVSLIENQRDIGEFIRELR